MITVELAPVEPFSLMQSAQGRATWRRAGHASLELVFEAAGAPCHAQVAQHPDGSLTARVDAADPDAALTQLRFILAVDVDHGPFLDMADADPLLGPLVSRRRGLRPIRTPTVAQSLVAALAGQLITAREAWLIERRISQRLARRHFELLLPLRADDLARAHPAEFVRLGLAPRRAAALARIVRTVDLDRLREVTCSSAVARLERERTLGPWSAGVIALGALGHYEHGLVGDLNLIRLCGNLLGRAATATDTAELLDRYRPWSGLAALHLMGHPLAHQRHAFAA